MSLGYNSNFKIHVPITSGSIEQLKVRSKILSKKERTERDILYLSSRAPWVKVSSAVNVVDGDEKTKDYLLAEENVLAGGTYDASSGKYKSGIFEKVSSYNLSEPGEGYRPVPGVVGITSQYLGTYGTYKETTIDIQVNSLDQLDLMDKLYFRPGMSLLVEWGHSVYATSTKNDYQIVNNIETVSNFFAATGQTGYKSISDVNKAIDEIKVKSGFNYDAAYGQIVNFNWTVNDDMTYTCSVRMLSHGSLIESLGLLSNASSNTGTLFAGEGEDVEDKPLSSGLTLLHDVFSAIMSLEDFTEATTNELTWDKLTENNQKKLGPLVAEVLTNVNSIGKSNGRPFNYVPFKYEGDKSEKTKYLRFIQISDFLNLVNEIFCPKNDGVLLAGFYTGEVDDNDAPINTTPYLTFPDHISADPSRVLFRSKTISDPFRYKIIEDFPEEENDILNIYVEVGFLLRTVESIVNRNSESDQTVYDFVYSIIKQVQSVMGDVNEFDIHPDGELNYIVDRKVLPTKSLLESKDAYIELRGSKSPVRGINITSEITNDLSTTLAIGATAGNTDLSNDVLNLQKWNENLEDRILHKIRFIDSKTKFRAKYDSTMQDRIKIQNFRNLSIFVGKVNYYKVSYENNEFNAKLHETSIWEKAGQAIRAYFNTGVVFYADKKYPKGAININAYDEVNISGLHKKCMQELLILNTIKQGENPPGLIPIDLSFIVDGLASFNIGEAFGVKKGVLPSKYDDTVGFIVTGIDHNIGTDGWTTQITGRMFIPDTIEKADIQDLPVAEEIVTTEIKDFLSDFEFAPIFMSPTGKQPISRNDLDVVYPTEIGLTQPRTTIVGAPQPGAPRGERKHQGWDIKTKAENAIYAPISGRVQWVSRFSVGKAKFRGIVGSGNSGKPKFFTKKDLRGGGYLKVVGTGEYEGWEFKIGYTKPNNNYEPNMEVTKGQPIGKALDLNVINTVRVGDQVHVYGGYDTTENDTDRMDPHLHVEARYNGSIYDMSQYDKWETK